MSGRGRGGGGGDLNSGLIVINNGGTVAVSQAGNYNYYWAIDGTTINTGGTLSLGSTGTIANSTVITT